MYGDASSSSWNITKFQNLGRPTKRFQLLKLGTLLGFEPMTIQIQVQSFQLGAKIMMISISTKTAIIMEKEIILYCCYSYWSKEHCSHRLG